MTFREANLIHCYFYSSSSSNEFTGRFHFVPSIFIFMATGGHRLDDHFHVDPDFFLKNVTFVNEFL